MIMCYQKMKPLPNDVWQSPRKERNVSEKLKKEVVIVGNIKNKNEIAMKTFLGIFLLLSVSFSGDWNNNSSKMQIDDICDLVGYTCLDCSNVVGDFEGADFDKLVKLDNGMIFEFNEYNYSYSYRPEVAVFSREISYQKKDMVIYKLIIEDEIYDAFRVR